MKIIQSTENPAVISIDDVVALFSQQRGPFWCGDHYVIVSVYNDLVYFLAHCENGGKQGWGFIKPTSDTVCSWRESKVKCVKDAVDNASECDETGVYFFESFTDFAKAAIEAEWKV